MMQPRQQWTQAREVARNLRHTGASTAFIEEGQLFDVMETTRSQKIARFQAFIPLLVLAHILGGAVIAWHALAGATVEYALTLVALTLLGDMLIFIALRRNQNGQLTASKSLNAISAYSLVSGALFAATVVLGLPEGSPFLSVAFILLVCVTSVIITVLSAMPVAAMLHAVGPFVAMIGLAPGSLPGWAFGASVALMGAAIYLGQRGLDNQLKEIVAQSRGDKKFLQLAADFEHSGQALFWETDRADRLTYLSRPAAERFGPQSDGNLPAGVGQIFDLPHGGETEDHHQSADYLLSTRHAFYNTPVIARIGGAESWWSLTGAPVIDDLGRFEGFRGFATELTGELRNDAISTQKSRFDTLTGLAGRALIQETLERSIKGEANGVAGGALFLLDLDRFKQVNDTFGHPVGDQLLKYVADRLRAHIGDSGRIGRLGGDEFMVVCPGETSRVALAELARTTIQTLSKKYVLDAATVSIGASVGIAIYPYDGDSAETIINRADMALYASKSDGRGVHRFYDATLTDAESERRQMRTDLREAINNGGIKLAYQPFVDAESENIIGFEALARWEHPTAGTIMPSVFLPLAASASLERQLDETILLQACKEAAKWPAKLRLAVNVTRHQIESSRLVQTVERALDGTGLSPSRLEIDIAENVFCEHREVAERAADELHRMGVRVVLDDFGAGETSLSNLKCAAIDKIKLDPSFIVGASDTQRRDAAILRSIVGLAESLGIDTLAEGVESEEDANLARLLGCDSLQGYAFGMAVAPEDIKKVLAENNKRRKEARRESRKASRTTIFRTAMIYHKDLDYKVVVRNISPIGASVECSKIFPSDTIVALDLGIGDPVSARVAWSDTYRMGLKFTQKFDMSLIRSNRPEGRFA